MDADAIRMSIEERTAQLRQRYPKMTRCDTALAQRTEDGRTRYSLYLDLRWPDTQILVSGPLRDNPTEAIEAACQEARSRIEQSPWANR